MQIKFRVWDDKKMWYPGDGDLNFILADGTLNTGHVNDDIFIIGCGTPVLVFPSEDKYMLWTGLKDRNGKDVYLGDIIDCSRVPGSERSSRCLHEIVWVQEVPCDNIGGMPGFYLSKMNDGYAWDNSEEILGNIHENPELIRGG